MSERTSSPPGLDGQPPTLDDLGLCFEGAVPAVIATAAADGTPNVTYLSRVRRVDADRIALSNQFFSKTARNLAENPRASLLVIEPTTHDQYRLTLRYERTERRGPVFDRLRADVEVTAAFEGMQDVFRLRAADVYRVLDIEQVPPHPPPLPPELIATPRLRGSSASLAELSARLGRSTDLDAIVETAVRGLAELLGFEHSFLLLLDETGTRLFTIASHGYATEGVGSEVQLGDGPIGVAAAQGQPVRLNNVHQLRKYSASVRRSYEDVGEIGPGREIPVPGLVDAESRMAVPALALGQLVGVLVVESRELVAFDDTDETLLSVVATLVANAIEAERARPADDAEPDAPAGPPAGTSAAAGTAVRFYAADGSTFLDGDYLIKGVAGRILWSLLNHHERTGRTDFTNREVRLDPTLELPEFRDNLESRLILLKRRLDERGAPVHIEKTGRGRFRLVVDQPLALEEVSARGG